MYRDGFSNRKFHVVRLTERLGVQYFVKSDFKKNYGDQIPSIDRQVEDEFLQNLQQSCYREKAHRKSFSLSLPF